MMSENPTEARIGQRRFAPLREHLLAEIDALALELEEADEATASGRAPISARADYLRAQDAHRRAQIAWTVARDREGLTAVAAALRDCRTALEAARVLMRG